MKKNLKNKTVFLRVDANVPIEHGIIQNDFRLQQLIPTLDYLKQEGALVTLATHIGRPEGTEAELSTQPVQEWLVKHGYPDVKVMQNLRFDPREQSGNADYARELKNGYDFYMNDAWGSLHRNDTSLTLLPKLFEPENVLCGPLVKKEMQQLAHVKDHPQKPYIVFLGGGKVSTKIPVIERLITTKKPTTIVLLPALCFTFLKALGKDVGKSLVDDNLLEDARATLALAKKNGIQIVFPSDYLIAFDTIRGPQGYCDAENFPQNAIGLAVGPRSLETYAQLLKTAHTIFYNGAMGIADQPDTMKPLHTLLSLIAQSGAYTVIGGGNSAAEAQNIGVLDAVDYCSTGGGSTLTYISNGTMPGLNALADCLKK